MNFNIGPRMMKTGIAVALSIIVTESLGLDLGMVAAILAGEQTALMVPTEILAEQHANSLQDLFQNQIRIALLTGSVKGKRREKILQDIKDQKIDLVVGIHALIQDDVHFRYLVFIVFVFQ